METKRLTAAQFTNSVGDGAFYVTSALFFTTVVGLTPAQVGVGLSCAWGLGFLAATPLGHAADRLGLRAGAVTLAVVTAAGIGLLATARSMTGFVLATSVYAMAQSGLGAVRQALLASLVAEAERVRVRARLQVSTNAGLGLGAGLGGLALLSGTGTAFLLVLAGDAAAFLAAALLLARLPEPGRPLPTRTGGSLAVLRDRPFVTATALNAVLYLYMPVLSVLVPLWIAARTTAPHWCVGALFVLNTVGVVAMQGRAARTVSSLTTATRSIAVGGGLLGLACLILWSSTAAGDPAAATAMLLIGGAILVTGEVLCAAGSWEVGFGLADPARPGQWQGFFSSSVPVARAAGPSVLVALVLDWPGPGWLILSAVFLTTGLAFGPLVRRAGAAPARDRERVVLDVPIGKPA